MTRREGPSAALGLAAIVAAAALFVAARLLWQQWELHHPPAETIDENGAAGLGDEQPK